MFEKEAEEIMMQKVIKENDCIMTPCKTLEDCQLCDFCFDDMVDAFKDGAEFGYNKANEWHKADVPTTPINKVVLGYIKDYNTKKFCLVKWNGEWWYDARTWNDKVKLIAWKEIVLPKDSE